MNKTYKNYSRIIFAVVIAVNSLTIAANKRSSSSPAVNGTTIVGVVKFAEDYPEREKITVTKNQAICGAFQYSERFVVSELTHGLKNVIVSLRGVSGKIKAIGSELKLDQNKCQYSPHVQAVPLGSKMQILNSDGILHNVHVYFEKLEPKSTVFNKAQPKFLKKISQTLDQVGTYYYKCDVHDHMSAYIAVMDHPYFSVTDDNGEFTIHNVPPGKHKVYAWHEVLGTLEKEVVVKKGEAARVEFNILPNE